MITDAFGVSIEDVRTVLAFNAAHQDELPLEYFPSEFVVEMGADRIDWSGCPVIAGRAGEAVIRETQVRPIDLIAHAGEGEEGLAYFYWLPVDIVRSVLNDYHQHKRQLAPAV